ncbi:MAG: Thiolase [uncultured Paraburkholderia sp.]|uniref:thiolase C-terminal domain-containing protein n=1 Tax=uncultured Paraburkholderia sp. TaxID=1822466 RepID=UPI002599061D|nr:thiolase family protein [uncultured Paraburkholderia sp.]CAH2894532.1 MAG: Thiolase [uncultured Paraburkholderia sp.]CAH2939756.1 MAG: Thiolase [uncultured Paraburkholderia sp.]
MKPAASLKNKVAIVGVGESDIGKIPHMSGLGLNAQAAKRALDDAGLKVSDIDGVLTAYSFTEPYFMLGSVICEYLGLKPRFNASLIAGGASPAVMLKHAAEAIVAGQAETILVCAGENRATGQTRDAAVASLMAVGHPYFEQPYGTSIPGFYAMIAQRHMHVYGTTREQLAQVAVNTRAHALLHPNAHMKTPLTAEHVLSAKPIADPLGMLDCCLISDAGGAFIVTSAERAAELASRPVYLQGIGEHHTHEHLMCAPSLTEFGATESGRIAYQMAGLGPADIDLAELYDCFTIVPIIELEELGFCESGAGGAFFAEGHARIGGKLPVNTHGGMLSHAHAGAAGGLFGIVEAVRQLRGDLGPRQVEGAEVALVHNEGGILSSHCTVILAKDKG